MYISILILFLSSYTFAEEAKEITSMKELRTVLASKLPVGMLFYAPWCGACKAMKDPFNKAAQLLKKEALLVKINAEKDEFKDIVDAFGIEAIPTLIIKHVGVMDSEHLTKAITGFTQKLDMKSLKQEQKQPAKNVEPKKPAPTKKTVAVPAQKKTLSKKAQR